jgi:hypothetical protein
VAKFMLENAKELDGVFPHGDIAQPVRYILWNEDLPEGETCHKVIVDHVQMMVYKGKALKLFTPMTPSQIKRTSPDWVEHYRKAEQDDTVVKLKRNVLLMDQLAQIFPN